MLVGTANVGGDNLHDDTVIAFALLALGDDGGAGGIELELGERNVLDLRASSMVFCAIGRGGG